MLLTAAAGFLALVLVAKASEGQTVGADVRALLPQGSLPVEVLELLGPPRLNELVLRLQRAAQADPAWFQEHARNATPGQPMPYDPKLGFTEAEYREFLMLMTDSMLLRPTRKATAVVEPAPSGWRFGAGTTVVGLEGIEIDTVNNEIHSTYGDLTATEPIAPSPEQRASGPWGGPHWRVENVDTATLTETIASFAIGKHETTGHTIIFYEAKRAVSGQIASRVDLFLRIVQ